VNICVKGQMETTKINYICRKIHRNVVTHFKD